MIVVRKNREVEVLIILPMGAKARELAQRLKKYGLDFELKPVFCG